MLRVRLLRLFFSCIFPTPKFIVFIRSTRRIVIGSRVLHTCMHAVWLWVVCYFASLNTHEHPKLSTLHDCELGLGMYVDCVAGGGHAAVVEVHFVPRSFTQRVSRLPHAGPLSIIAACASLGGWESKTSLHLRFHI